MYFTPGTWTWCHLGRALLSLSSCRFLSNAISENSSLITLFKYLAVEASKIGSVFLTLLRKQHRESLQMNPLLQDALRSSLCFPGFLPGHWLSCYLSSQSPAGPTSHAAELTPSLSSKCHSPQRQRGAGGVSSPCFLGLQDGNWALQDSGPGGWTGALLSPLRASDFYLPDFTVC